MKIASAEVKQSQGGNDMIVVSYEVTKGDDKGARVYENYVLTENSLWKLKGMLQAIGMKADGKIQLDVDKLVGKVCQINVQHEEYDGRLRARVESVMKFSASTADDEDFEDDVDDEAPFNGMNEPEEEEKPKKTAKKAAKKAEPEEEPEDDDDDWDEDEDEEPEEKPAKKKATKKEEKKPEKKETKKSKKDEEPEDDDDWDDEEDWDEE